MLSLLRDCSPLAADSDLSLGSRSRKGQVLLWDQGSNRKDSMAAAAYEVWNVLILPTGLLTLPDSFGLPYLLSVFYHLQIASAVVLGGRSIKGQWLKREGQLGSHTFFLYF